MAEELPSLHIDSDWKKQAQEEKRRLIEAEQKRAATPPPAAPSAPSLGADMESSGARSGASAGRSARGRRELPPPTFPTLVQSLLTQVLYYLGELSATGDEPPVNVDLAKHQLDLLAMLDEKTANNLAPEEREALDHALYEGRNRFVSVASQLI